METESRTSREKDEMFFNSSFTRRTRMGQRSEMQSKSVRDNLCLQIRIASGNGGLSFFGHPDVSLEDDFIALRTRYTLKIMKKLDEAKATGPDNIPASILRMIAESIALPFTILCRRLLAEGIWPDIWKLHQICPLYKRLSAFNPSNYRGIHLTSILSKIAERVIGRSLVPFLQTRAFAPCQWALSRGLSARDLVTALMMSLGFWLSAQTTRLLLT